MWAKRRRFPLRACAVLALIAAFFGWRIGCRHDRPISADWSSTPLAEGDYEIIRIPSGDKLEVRRAGESARRVFLVRLLGIKLEDRSFEARARECLQRRLASTVCRLEFDKRRLDREGAFLAYVYVGDELLNEALVREGLASIDLKPDDSSQIARRLSDAQAEAKAARRGIWRNE